MSDQTHTIISMLVAEEKLSLFTIKGNIIEIKNEDAYDVERIINDLTEKLNGTNTVDVNLIDYAITPLTSLVNQDGFEEGQVIVHMVEGKQVEGIFFARKPEVAVKVEGETVVIPEVNNLAAQIKRSQEEGTTGVTAFLKRLAPVLKNRKHSAEDLMKFIKGSELPLTNDGRVIVYKRVKSTKTKGVYVDCHSGNIKQRVGSRVIMDAKLVDDNRRNDCSNGLHVANLGYNFSGDTILMILVNPEDFIAVPQYDHKKARVCQYDIIGTLTPHSFKLVDNSMQIKDDPTMETLIQAAILGEIDDPIEEVHVGHKKIIKVVPLNGTKKAKRSTTTKRPSGKPLKKTENTETTKTSRIVSTARKAKNTALGIVKKLSIKEQFEELYKKFDEGDIEAFNEMLALKKQKKKSWSSIGFSAVKIKRIENQIKNPQLFAPVPKPKKVKPKTINEQARELFNDYQSGNLASFDILVDLKTKKKKGWAKLGFSASEIAKIEKQLKS